MKQRLFVLMLLFLFYQTVSYACLPVNVIRDQFQQHSVVRYQTLTRKELRFADKPVTDGFYVDQIWYTPSDSTSTWEIILDEKPIKGASTSEEAIKKIKNALPTLSSDGGLPRSKVVNDLLTHQPSANVTTCGYILNIEGDTYNIKVTEWNLY